MADVVVRNAKDGSEQRVTLIRAITRIGGSEDHDIYVRGVPKDAANIMKSGDAFTLSALDNPLLINDPRYAPAGVLAPKSKADLAFTMHMLSWLAVNGTAAIVEFPGVLYRSGAEQKIRKYLIDNNYVDTVIQLPPDLFFGTTIATCVIVLKKSKADNKTLFIDASAQFVRGGNKNKLTAENQQAVLDAFIQRGDVDHFARLVDNSEIAENDYNLSVSSYVEERDTREAVDIVELNAEIVRIVARQQELRTAIDEIVSDLEGSDR